MHLRDMRLPAFGNSLPVILLVNRYDSSPINTY